ncbi:MAG: phosphatidylinositol-specific phospholipase C1-like protein [Candidatus Hydrogenedentes bacterium]|nr:phosphatidylinositol-specific phospholipase C1-like protein [Candidatus Hydrogenedentota bacterium]
MNFNVFVSTCFLLGFWLNCWVSSDGPKMNQIQVIGTHNSYHKKPPYLDLAIKVDSRAKNWDYEHLPLDIQLDNGVRSFELDVHKTSNGWEVMHVPHFDDKSTCSSFEECLKVVKRWSDLHPYHVPIIILVEWKVEGPIIDKSIKVPEKSDLDELDGIITNIFPQERLIIPDMVRGDFQTLEEAILKKGWPYLQDVKGRVMFVFHNRGRLRNIYLEGHETLKGRVMFVDSRPGESVGSVLIIDNPFNEKIPQWVKMGYIVRVFGGNPRKDNVEECKLKDEIAFCSGAHIISTDNPPGSPDKNTGYFTVFTDGSTVRWNPVNYHTDSEIKPEIIQIDYNSK